MREMIMLGKMIEYSKYARILLVLAILCGSVFAAGVASSIASVVSVVCNMLKGILPIIVFTLFILAGVAYGIGNFFGAETRAKAQGWGMSALTGAIIMLVIYIMADPIITALYGSASCG